MKKVICFIIFLSAGPLFAQPVEPNEIQRLKTKIEQLEKNIGKQNAKLNVQEKEIKRLLGICQRNGIETNPEKVERPLPRSMIAQSFSKPLKMGQIAYVGGDNFLTAKQVIDENNVICKLTIKSGLNPEQMKEYRRSKGITIGESEGKEVSRFMLSDGLSSLGPGLEVFETIWLANFDTTGLADGSVIKCNRPLKVSGTKTYKTVDTGTATTATVFLLEPYQIR